MRFYRHDYKYQNNYLKEIKKSLLLVSVKCKIKEKQMNFCFFIENLVEITHYKYVNISVKAGRKCLDGNEDEIHRNWAVPSFRIP